MEKKNKKGWVEIVEAVVAILLITGVLLIVIMKNSSPAKDISERVYNSEITIIRQIQLNDTLRDKVLSITDAQLPSDWNNDTFPADVKNTIITRSPDYLVCVAKICDPADECYLTSYSVQDVYSQDSIVSATATSPDFNPRKLKLFCWQK